MTEAQEKQVKDEPKPEPAPREGGFSGALLWVFLFLIAYPLSIGPAARLHRACRPAQPVIEAVYAPITVLMDHCEPVRNVFLWYVCKIWKVD